MELSCSSEMPPSGSSLFRRVFGEVFASGGGEVAADRAVALSWGNGATESAGINRLEVGNERVLQRRCFDGFEGKPVSVAALLKKVRGLLDRAGLSP